MLQILIAILAGALTIGAPCILPVLPILLGTSVGQASKTRPLFITFGFVLTFAAVGLLFASFTRILGLSQETLRTIAIVLLGLFGLFMIWPTLFERLTAYFNSYVNKANEVGTKFGQGNLGGFVLGIMIGIIWTPCAGPVLGSILTLIATQTDLARAGILLTAYAVGAGLPMIVIAYGGQLVTTKVAAIAKYSGVIQKAFGILILALALAMYFKYDLIIQAKLIQFYPSLSPKLELKGHEMQKTDFQNLGPAPEFIGINHWLNSGPLTVSQLKGKVVLVDFWTFSCINCIRTLPYVTKWYDTYKDQGLVVVGVHTPEFPFEKETANVQTAIARHKINYPVAQDNDFATWNNYNNQYWPAEYLIDKTGNVVYTHFGEGNYDHTENAIRQLLGLDMETMDEKGSDLSGVKSPEMYFGTSRLEYLSPSQQVSSTPQVYNLPQALALNNFAFSGSWQFNPENVMLSKPNGKIQLKFHAAKVFIVAQSAKPQTLKIIVDGILQPDVQISESKLYTLFNSEEYNDHVIEISIPEAGFKAFTFTFG